MKNMFYNSQLDKDKLKYEEYLKLVGYLSNLFSDSNTPYLYYRIAEKIFCKSFNAIDLSRSDVSVDAKKGDIGIGLKTFLVGNNKSFQKIAEFNKDRDTYKNLTDSDLVYKIAKLRNERINLANRLHNLDNSIYHCVVRDIGKFKVYEESMDLINYNNIKQIKKIRNSILFNDGIHEYSFSLSKSTLNKRFVTQNTTYEFPVKVLNNPLDELQKCLKNDNLIVGTESTILQTIYLPLYGKGNIVFERSALNQWNAKGRQRDPNEVYIPIPSIIHKKYTNFFPNRDTSFSLKLPNGKIMKSKVCQDGSKALMSSSNKELGLWILRDVLQLKEGELLTYNRLQVLGIDSVRIDKINNENYEINFSSNGSYDKFINNN